MRLLFIISVFSIFTFLSCDGRDRVYQTNTEVLAKHNLLQSFSKKTTLIPESYTRIETDTILSNQFRIKLAYYSLADRLEITRNNDTQLYANFEAQLQVTCANNILLNETINKALFKRFNSIIDWDDAIMQHVWIDYESASENNVQLNVSFYTPKTGNYKDFCLTIDRKGALKIKEVNLLKITT